VLLLTGAAAHCCCSLLLLLLLLLPTQVAALGKSGMSVGYYDTEQAAARAYDRTAIGLLGWQGCEAVLNFPAGDYSPDSILQLQGKSRDEVKELLKNDRGKVSGWVLLLLLLLVLLTGGAAGGAGVPAGAGAGAAVLLCCC
jgi:hypothetical protein